MSFEEYGGAREEIQNALRSLEGARLFKLFPKGTEL